MTKSNMVLKENEGGGCLPNGRCYRWTYDPIHGFRFRGPGLSQSHQPGKRHPVWGLVEDWKKSQEAA